MRGRSTPRGPLTTAREQQKSTAMKTEWIDANRANWDERVPVHLAAKSYDLTALRAGQGRLHTIEEEELGNIAGLRVLHLQCHFGRDSLTLAQRGAEVVGLDFSAPAIDAARGLARELCLSQRARFVLANVYDARDALPEAAAFDLVYVTWGAIYWLPDIRRWAQIVAHYLRPGGTLYLAEGHPSALVFDDLARAADAKMPGWFAPYFQSEPMVIDDARDYANADVVLTHRRQYSWMHPLGSIISALRDAGLSLAWLHEHAAVPWPMFDCLVAGDDGMYRWPAQQWLPLAFSLQATSR